MFYQSPEFKNLFIEFIQLCNQAVMKIYDTSFNVYFKEDKSPLTIADEEVNLMICDFLKSINNKYEKDILIISEENKKIDYNNRRNYDYAWIVDPIDGTKEFVKKNGEFTINIGLIFKNTPVFGIVSVPVTGDIYYGIDGVGSYKLSKNNTTQLIVSPKDFNDSNIRITVSNSHLNNKTSEFISKFNNPELVRVGSSIKLLYIAENKADIYPRIAPTSEWDTCAAHAVVKFAGGRVVIYQENKSYDELDEVIYNKSNLLNPYFICY